MAKMTINQVRDTVAEAIGIMCTGLALPPAEKNKLDELVAVLTTDIETED